MRAEGTTDDAPTPRAADTTDLAVMRTYLAAERTLLGWIRTALSMITFGFTIGKLGKVVEEIQLKGIISSLGTVSIKSLAYFLVVLGTVALLVAVIQHARRVRNLIAMGLPRQLKVAFIVALFLVAVGGLALTSLVLEL